MRARAAAKGREVKFGLRMHLIVRETEDEAWARRQQADRPSLRRSHRRRAGKFAEESDSVGQKRMSRAAWRRHAATSSRSRPTSGPASGSCAAAPARRWSAIPKTVAARLREYQALGIETVIASGYPHLEEAYKVAELLFPELGIGAGAAPEPRHGAGRVRRRRVSSPPIAAE